MRQGPPLEALLRRLAECPSEFLAEPRIGARGEIAVDAVVGDLLLALGKEMLGSDLADFRTHDRDRRNWLRLVLVGCWLAYDPWFQRAQPADAVLRWLLVGLVPLSRLIAADHFVTDPDRREELCRILLHSLALYPAGESENRARDRLDTVDSVARSEVVQRMKAQQERARKLREEMETQRAAEAAARYSRE